MQELIGDIWDYHKDGWIVVTTNGIRKSNGDAVMGAGIALEAAKRFPHLPRELGERLRTTGNHNNWFHEYRIVTFPTKNHWKEKSDIDLIMRNALDLNKSLMTMRYQQRPIKFYLPRLGCGNGGLEWHNVSEAVRPWLNEPEFTFVTRS